MAGQFLTLEAIDEGDTKVKRLQDQLRMQQKRPNKVPPETTYELGDKFESASDDDMNDSYEEVAMEESHSVLESN
ncbi:hypothetical protein OS493_007039 [Desmophyllum pertusum]|uniref:Uncharacterized protein n=1 Tax=Desmophyllum pertusum TaxID=174260 RepID=A0A9W9ZFB2_9CNID|nr:hypothetical protein OS493_007039 [Desmophyllum pertusum]